MADTKTRVQILTAALERIRDGAIGPAATIGEESICHRCKWFDGRHDPTDACGIASDALAAADAAPLLDEGALRPIVAHALAAHWDQPEHEALDYFGMPADDAIHAINKYMRGK